MLKKPKRHGLTPRQRRFVSAYLVSLNASDAARKSGYKGKNADVIGAMFKKHPLVRISIDNALSEAMGADASTLKHKVIEELRKEAFEAETVISMQVGESTVDRYNPAKMKALELLAKYGGLLIEKHEITGKDGGPIPIQYTAMPEEAKE